MVLSHSVFAGILSIKIWVTDPPNAVCGIAVRFPGIFCRDIHDCIICALITDEALPHSGLSIVKRKRKFAYPIENILNCSQF
jgi:hypothetical protein